VLLREGKPVHLTPKAFETLLVLVAQGGHVVRKGTCSIKWPDTFVGETTLTQNIDLEKVLAEASLK
jgi:DNA-binding winged helix-turn-helix (wHTH) protein